MQSRIGSSRTQAPSQVALPRMVNAPSVKVAAPKPAGKLLKRQRDDLTKVHAASAEKTEGYDVYIYEPERLEEGVRKHTLSVFVADESGLINRVAGVFARRGANIESLAVGLTVDTALFTIVATGTDATVANLCKQLAKLVNVRYVEDITDEQHIERELMMIKVHAPSAEARIEINHLVDIFRAHIVDVGDSSFTIVVTGDPGKMMSFQKVMSKFGVIELCRTGRIAVKRGEHLFNDSGYTWAAANAAEARARAEENKATSREIVSRMSVDGESNWSVYNILDAAYAPDATVYEAATLSVDVSDVPGVLNQVTGVISRRGYNVQSLAVGPSEKEGMSRITMVVPGEPGEVAKLTKQLLKLVNVNAVTELHKIPHVARELMLVKVSCDASQRGELVDLARIFHGAVCDVSKTTLTLEVVGKETKMRALREVLEPYGILEIARTGRVALERELGVDSRYLNNMAGQRVML